MKSKLSILRVLLPLSLAFATPAFAGLVNANVSGDVFTADIDLAGGIGGEVTVSFEEAKKLTTSSLGASVDLLDATDLTAIQSRLPDVSVSVPSAYPVLLTIEPPANEDLSFEGPATIEIYTHQLAYLTGSKLRLLAAPLGGDFVDITHTVAGGSYRVRGSKGEFSEFLIATDLRSLDTVIQTKLDRLDATLTNHQADIQAMVYTTLRDLLDDVQAAYDADDPVGAISDLDVFLATVVSESGSKVPDDWRASRDLDNVAGKLRAIGATLRFSLVEKAGI